MGIDIGNKGAKNAERAFNLETAVSDAKIRRFGYNVRTGAQAQGFNPLTYMQMVGGASAANHGGATAAQQVVASPSLFANAISSDIERMRDDKAKKKAEEQTKAERVRLQKQVKEAGGAGPIVHHSQSTLRPFSRMDSLRMEFAPENRMEAMTVGGQPVTYPKAWLRVLPKLRETRVLTAEDMQVLAGEFGENVYGLLEGPGRGS